MPSCLCGSGLQGRPTRTPAELPVRTRGRDLVALWECGLQVRACFGKIPGGFAGYALTTTWYGTSSP